MVGLDTFVWLDRQWYYDDESQTNQRIKFILHTTLSSTVSPVDFEMWTLYHILRTKS